MSAVDLTGRVAIVTGSTAGLGARFAHVLADAGATVVVTGRRTERITEVVRAITGRGGKAHGVRLDVADPASIESCLTQVTEELGVPQILINNAGIPDAQRAHKMTPELVDAVLDTNVRGPWLMATGVASRLIAAELPGRIVNISSMAAYHYAGNGAALYSTTKAAVSRMTEALAVEWSRNFINVNAIAPGVFASEMTDGMLARVGDIAPGFPRKRIGLPEQLDSTLLYLVSDASEAVTGTVVKIDDGQLPR
ncbi:SDR family NAD(P)-dependent oxidoreductase [Rhodococcus sp. IEGM 1408]|uniref:SDR family NAD(P)-dependent oxidoreductase n=1 Tax=Rhodococcus sp. IEGM 1408 TaxID=3082220 RepID=UPI00295382E8|nr:SDR family NAD(P)-dependent oxidoreductase [Rhodococcus sp. IEGM 1408]MDV8003020.1 SDR family oxidoreductase [Rhodococcus sp. IEGM 1408]